MDIGIVTSFYNGYGRFIRQWVASICELKTKPKAITIIASGEKHGMDKEIQEYFLNKCEEIKIIPTIKLIHHKGMGYARNIAVQSTDTKWIMYLDTDDVILPNAIDTFIRYKCKADVISGGLRYRGIKKHRDRLYKNASRERIIKGGYCACSHAVFKKKFWEMSPFILKNDYVEQVFWLGLAQKGAKFIGTDEVCTVYLTRREGHNCNMTKKDWAECNEQKRRFLKEGVIYD